MWAQCSVGQQSHNNKCTGEASKLSWAEAKHAADTARIADFSDWRLPTVYELSHIAELQCHQPAINLMLFPTTPAIDFWSATEFINNTDMAWLVHFAYGENHSAKKANPAAIRLVRSIANNGK